MNRPVPQCCHERLPPSRSSCCVSLRGRRAARRRRLPRRPAPTSCGSPPRISAGSGCVRRSVCRNAALDQLAREGARYTNAFSAAPVCAPSRSRSSRACTRPRSARCTCARRACLSRRQGLHRVPSAPPATTARTDSKTDYNVEAPPSNRRRTRCGTTRATRRTGGTGPTRGSPSSRSSTSHYAREPDKS